MWLKGAVSRWSSAPANRFWAREEAWRPHLAGIIHMAAQDRFSRDMMIGADCCLMQHNDTPSSWCQATGSGSSSSSSSLLPVSRGRALAPGRTSWPAVEQALSPVARRASAHPRPLQAAADRIIELASASTLRAAGPSHSGAVPTLLFSSRAALPFPSHWLHKEPRGSSSSGGLNPMLTATLSSLSDPPTPTPPSSSSSSHSSAEGNASGVRSSSAAGLGQERTGDTAAAAAPAGATPLPLQPASPSPSLSAMDWQIVREMAQHVWPAGNWEYRGRVAAALSLLVGAKVRENLWHGLTCEWPLPREGNDTSSTILDV